MKNYEKNEQLEAHLRRTLNEVARTTPRVITPSASRDRAPSRRSLSVAASLLALCGLGGLVVAAQQSGDSSLDESAGSVAVSQPDPGVEDLSTGSLLATPVRGDVAPGIGIDIPGWSISPTPEVGIGGTSTPSTACPGCGADRVVFEANGPSLSGALFTTWIMDASFDPELYDEPVSIGDVEGTARTRAESTPASQNRVTIAWPTNNDQTLFLDAVGLTLDDVVAIAEASIPLTEPPPGFHRVDPPDPSAPATFVVTLTDGDRFVSVFAANTGLGGLLDWRNPFPHLLLNRTQPIAIDGSMLAVEIAEDTDPADGLFGAYWVAGDWGYRASGSGFGSQAEFTDVLAALRLTDTTITTEVNIMPFSFEIDLSTGWIDGADS